MTVPMKFVCRSIYAGVIWLEREIKNEAKFCTLRIFIPVAIFQNV